MAYTRVSTSSAGNSSGGDLTLTKPAGTVDGNKVGILVYFEPDTTTITVSGGPWESVTIANTGAFKLQLFIKTAASEPASYTISNSTAGNQWRAAAAASWSGGSGSGTLIDVSSTAQADGQLDTAQTAPAVTPTADHDLLIFGYGNFGGVDPTSLVGKASTLAVTLGGCCIGEFLDVTPAASTGTTREAGAGTQDYAALHAAIFLSSAAAATSLPLPPPRMPLAILAI